MGVGCFPGFQKPIKVELPPNFGGSPQKCDKFIHLSGDPVEMCIHPHYRQLSGNGVIGRQFSTYSQFTCESFHIENIVKFLGSYPFLHVVRVSDEKSHRPSLPVAIIQVENCQLDRARDLINPSLPFVCCINSDPHRLRGRGAHLF